MKIDCRNLACPEPVLKTKKAIEESNGEVVEVLLNSFSSVSNVTRLAENLGYSTIIEEKGNEEVVVKIQLDKDNKEEREKTSKQKFLNKTIFIKDDKIGEGEFGNRLIKGFIKTLLEFDNLPTNIVFVNKGVLLTTKQENQDVIESLKALENRGVKIYSCGMCLEYYKIDFNELKVGEIGNAYDTVNMILTTDVVSL